jgi:hypothetical protein
MINCLKQQVWDKRFYNKVIATGIKAFFPVFGHGICRLSYHWYVFMVAF